MTDVTDNQQFPNRDSGVVLNQRRFWAVVVISLVLLVIGVWLVWRLVQPSYTVLIHTNQMDDMASIARELQNNGIKYQYNSSTGELSVPQGQIHQGRMVLAAKEIPATPSYGANPRITRSGRSSLLTQHDDSRLQQETLEQELATTIASLDPVQSARVHLALTDAAKDGDQPQSRASVVVHLYPGRRLNSGQINAISHLVSSSTHGLSLSQIAIVDQTGRLLKSAGAADVNPLTTSQFDHRQQIEQDYIERIEKILTPIVGAGNIRCQVTAVMDFDRPATNESSTITTSLPGKVRRLSVTVLVDDRQATGTGGDLRRVSRTQKELERIGVLIKEAIGYQAERGDKVNVINEPFSGPVVDTPSRNSEIFEAWTETTNQVRYMIAVAALLLVLIVLAIRRSGTPRARDSHNVSSHSQQVTPGSPVSQPLHSKQEDIVEDDHASQRQASTPRFEQKMQEIRELVLHDPKRVAQVLKQWVKEG